MTDTMLLLALGWGACDVRALERDAARFLAPGEFCTARRVEAQQFLGGLRGQYRWPLGSYGTDPAESHGAARAEAHWCWECWDTLEDVRLWGGGYRLRTESGYPCHGGRDFALVRHKLHRLRTLLGDEAFYTGTMPPAVPVWRLRYRD